MIRLMMMGRSDFAMTHLTDELLRLQRHYALDLRKVLPHFRAFTGVSRRTT
jgi:hypothetical protein